MNLGHKLEEFPARIAACWPRAAGLLVLAGADHDAIARWVDVGRERATTPRHSI